MPLCFACCAGGLKPLEPSGPLQNKNNKINNKIKLLSYSKNIGGIKHWWMGKQKMYGGENIRFLYRRKSKLWLIGDKVPLPKFCAI